MSIKTIDATVLRANLGDAIDEVKKGNILEVRRHGKGEVALVDLAMLEDWLAVQDPLYAASIREARTEARKGQAVAFEEVYRDIIGVDK